MTKMKQWYETMHYRKKMECNGNPVTICYVIFVSINKSIKKHINPGQF